MHSRALLIPSLPPAPNLSPRGVSRPCDTVAGVLGFVVRLETTRGGAQAAGCFAGGWRDRGRGPVPAACLSSQRKRPEGSMWGRGRAGKPLVVLSARTPDPALGGNVGAVSGRWVHAGERALSLICMRVFMIRDPNVGKPLPWGHPRVTSRGAGPPRAPRDRRGPADPPFAIA